MELKGVIAVLEKNNQTGTRNLFVFTDDEQWLNKEREMARVTHPQWRIYNLESPKPPAPPDPKLNGVDGISYPGAFHTAFFLTFLCSVLLIPLAVIGYQYMRARGGSNSGVYFLASLELAQQCESFIAHAASATPGLFFNSMCLQHQVDGQRLQGICPTSYDLGGRYGK